MLLIIGALAIAAKVAIILFFAVLVAGLIFRTKDTIGLMALGAFLTGLLNAPLPTLGIVALLVIISLIFKAKEKKATVALLEKPTDKPDA